MDWPNFGIVFVGESYDVLDQSVDGAWYQVCCVRQRPVWISAQVVSASGCQQPATR
jgi:hypothetical protein